MSIFTFVDNPKHHLTLCLFPVKHFSKYRHALLAKCQFLQFVVNILSIFSNIYPISVNICQYTVLCTVPTTRYCVRYLLYGAAALN